MNTVPNTYAEAQAEGIPYKAWLYMCEQEEIEREQVRDCSDDDAWCYYCDRPRNDCACHLDPNGPPESSADPRDEEETIFDRACERAPLPYSEQDFFTALADPVSREIFPGEDPDSICMCPACSAMRTKFDHDVALARAVLHCPEPIPEEVEMVEAALNTPIARFIQGQLAIEKWLS